MNYMQIPIDQFRPIESGKVIVCFNIFEYKLDDKGNKTEKLNLDPDTIRSHKFETNYIVTDSGIKFPAIFEKIEKVTHVIIPA